MRIIPFLNVGKQILNIYLSNSVSITRASRQYYILPVLFNYSTVIIICNTCGRSLFQYLIISSYIMHWYFQRLSLVYRMDLGLTVSLYGIMEPGSSVFYKYYAAGTQIDSRMTLWIDSFNFPLIPSNIYNLIYDFAWLGFPVKRNTGTRIYEPYWNTFQKWLLHTCCVCLN